MEYFIEFTILSFSIFFCYLYWNQRRIPLSCSCKCKKTCIADETNNPEQPDQNNQIRTTNQRRIPLYCSCKCKKTCIADETNNPEHPENYGIGPTDDRAPSPERCGAESVQPNPSPVRESCETPQNNRETIPECQEIYLKSTQPSGIDNELGLNKEQTVASQRQQCRCQNSAIIPFRHRFDELTSIAFEENELMDDDSKEEESIQESACNNFSEVLCPATGKNAGEKPNQNDFFVFKHKIRNVWSKLKKIWTRRQSPNPKKYRPPTFKPTRQRTTQLWSETWGKKTALSLTSQELNRQESIHEILQGEIHFIEDLLMIQTVYHQSLTLSGVQLFTAFGSVELPGRSQIPFNEIPPPTDPDTKICKNNHNELKALEQALQMLRDVLDQVDRSTGLAICKQEIDQIDLPEEMTTVFEDANTVMCRGELETCQGIKLECFLFNSGLVLTRADSRGRLNLYGNPFEAGHFKIVDLGSEVQQRTKRSKLQTRYLFRVDTSSESITLVTLDETSKKRWMASLCTVVNDKV
ncbi:hypothetical protein OUZ56_004154 [Daphnia magna]|uniref:PH domain-containing protein n=1 Tax=Daphnia magna TaxID=35525 RepID=A0ABQ9YNX8_9CRUS|nr:hypothetical protein OUZ56_004154 [Daphnia magna]